MSPGFMVAFELLVDALQLAESGRGSPTPGIG